MPARRATRQRAAVVPRAILSYDAIMTERLYYTDSYLRTFEARIVDRADDGRTVYLDRTTFYPTSGGQLFDTGTLAGVAVTDVVDEGDRIAHILAAPARTPRRVTAPSTGRAASTTCSSTPASISSPPSSPTDSPSTP